jgi:Ca2+-binding EF-hand superfamily protein
MPEEERRSDPFGAGRGKTVRQHADSISGKLKKHLHDKYYIPPYRSVNRNWEITFASLGWKRRTIQKFWRLFCQINVCRDGAIKLEEFLDFFDLDWTPWTERCFRYFDTTGGGDIDFLEFVISVWNVCTFKIDTLSNFTFDMYDLDSDGELSIPEIEGMVEELYGEKGGRKCLAQITQFAEERGGALSLNSFIAFTASHQMLLFPMFLIQQKLQRRVFGRRFWQAVDRKSKENRHGSKNHNEFNPRHVQILLRTYQTGGAAAVLSHTGDPNKGLRDWYEKQKQNDIEDIPAEERPSLHRWQSIKSKVGSIQQAQKVLSRGEAIRHQTLKKMKSFKSRRGDSDIDRVADASAMGYSHEKRDHMQPLPSAPPLHPTDESITVSANHRVVRPPSASSPPPDVADALKRIRAKRANTPVKETRRNESPAATNSRPGSASTPPRDVAKALKSIRAKRAMTPSNINNNASQSEHEPKRIDDSGPDTATSPTPDIASIRPTRDSSSKKKTRHRRRSTNAIPNNVRQRQAGSMFVSAGQSDGWLK